MRRSMVVVVVCAIVGCVSSDRPARTIDLNYNSVPNLSKKELKVAMAQVEGDDAELSNVEIWSLTSLPDDAPCIWIVDGRTRTMYLGWSFPKTQMLSWLKDGITYRLKMIATPIEQIPEGDSYINLHKAYIRQESSAMAGVVMLTVGGSGQERIYRGSQIRLNWFGSDQEYSRIMSEALDDALLNMVEKPKASIGCSQPQQTSGLD